MNIGIIIIIFLIILVLCLSITSNGMSNLETISKNISQRKIEIKKIELEIEREKTKQIKAEIESAKKF